MRRVFASIVLGVVGLVCAFHVQALNLDSNNYAVYEQSVGGSSKDLFIVPRELFVILHGSPSTPLVFVPDVPGYMISMYSDGTVSSPVEFSLNAKELDALGTYTLSSYKMLEADFSGDGHRDILFQGSGTDSSFILVESGAKDAPSPSIYHDFGSSLAQETYSRLDIRKDLSPTNQADIVAIADDGFQLVYENTGLGFSNSLPDTSLVGAISGEFRVNEQGAATYNIPIMTFAGTAGVSPHVSLSYNSQQGWGLAGTGWSVGGLSVISRCRQTKFQDGQPLALLYDENDRFCLDGQRLVLSGGTAVYGDPNSKYRLEIDDGTEVTALGGSSGKPQYFFVRKKDGSLSYYGNSSNSRILAGGETLSWALREFRDSASNPIKYTYFNDADGFRIKRIDYAFGGATSQSTTTTRIEFDYESRPDIRSGLTNGDLTYQRKRLKEIKSYNDGILLRSYKLAYLPILPEHGLGNRYVVADKSYLQALYECVNGSCIKPTKFNWLARSGNGIDWNRAQVLSFESSDNVVSFWKPLDFNGDGITDLAVVLLSYSTSGSGAGDLVSQRIRIYEALVDPVTGKANGAYATHLAYNLTGNWGSSSQGNLSDIEVLDYNADGRQDLVFNSGRVLLSKPVAGGGWRLGDGTSNVDLKLGMLDNSATANNATLADFNSDGLVDIAYGIDSGNGSGGMYLQYLEFAGTADSATAYQFGVPINLSYLNSTTDPFNILGQAIAKGRYGDFTGNGEMEVVLGTSVPMSAPGIAWYTFASDGSLTPRGELVADSYGIGLCNKLEIGDINGDGISDWLKGELSTAPNSKNCVWQAVISGSSNQSGPALFEVPYYLATQPRLLDFNRDGYLDIFWHDVWTSELKIRLWDPSVSNFSAADLVFLRGIAGHDIDSSNKPQHTLIDFNGDGALDYLVSSGSKLLVYPSVDLSAEAVIQVIDNGLGNKTSIEFDRISRRSPNYYALDDRVEFESSSHTKSHCDPGYQTGYRITRTWVPANCYDVEITTTNASEFYAALNSEWSTDLGGLYSDYGLTPKVMAKKSPVLEFTAPITVVTKVSGTAPTTANSSDDDLSVIRYEYSEAKIQAAGRGFLGFRTISSIDEQSGVVTTTRYRQDFPFIGAPLYTEVIAPSGGVDQYAVVKRSFNDYDYAEFNSADTGSLAKRYQVWAKNVIETTYDLNGDETSHVVTFTSQPDLWGNILHTSVSTYSADDHVNYLTQVETNNQFSGGSWGTRWGRLSASSVIHRRSGEPSVSRSSSFTYYTSNDFKKNLLESETVNANPADSSTHAITTTYFYEYTDGTHAFGNKTRKVVTSGTSSARETRWVYSGDGRYLVSTTNAKGQVVEEILERNDYGSAARILGLNGLETVISYDTLGREWQRSDSSGAWLKTTYSDSGLVAGSVYKLKSESASGAISTDYYDPLGRVIAKAVLGIDDSYDWVETDYDSSGRVERRSEPYEYGSSGVYYTTFSYDVLNRITSTQLPGISAPATVEYSGLETIYKDPAGNQRIERRNAAGEVVQVEDAIKGLINHAYTADGNLASVDVVDFATGSRIVTTMQYNSHGQKIKMMDPDKGTWFYEYNGFGELVFQYKVTSELSFSGDLAELKTDPSRYSLTNMIYDELGRMTYRVDFSEGLAFLGYSYWQFDTALNGVGKLAYESGGGVNKTFVYGAYTDSSRTDSVTYSGGIDAVMTTTYDNVGRPYIQTDAVHMTSGTETKYKNGFVEEVVDLEYGSSVYRVLSMDARGNVTSALQGGVLTVNHYYDPATGRLDNITSTTPLMVEVQNQDFNWDDLGNMSSREDHVSGLGQSFCYDALNRLTKTHQSVSAVCSSSDTPDITYNGFGNILSKAGVGAYTYSQDMAVRPHAVVKAGNTSLVYDMNGNVVADGVDADGDGALDGPLDVIERSFTYSNFDKPTRITKGSYAIDFSYDANRSRWKRVDNDGSSTTTTYYLGNVEIIDDGNSVKYRRTLGGNLVLKYDASGQVLDIDLLLKDALGSVVGSFNALTWNAAPSAFDPWGQRVSALDYTSALSGASLTPFLDLWNTPTTRGFTGHEMLDGVGVIHMNGRIYDPRLGRFLQADTIVDGVRSTQGYNRYSYVHNNPLSGVDPSGHFIKSLTKKFGLTGGMYAGLTGDFVGAAGIDKVHEITARSAVASQIYITAVTAISAYYCGSCSIGISAHAASDMAYYQTGSAKEAIKVGAIVGISTWAFGGSTPSSSLSQVGVQVSLNAIAAANPELGQVLMFLYGMPGYSISDFATELVGYGLQYQSSRVLAREAAKHGLTLQEVNLFLALNSKVGLEVAGSTYNTEGKNLVTGFTRRKGGLIDEKYSGWVGIFWDLNDSLLNAQGLLDAVSLEVARSGYSGHLTGHSLGAWRVNTLHRQGFISSAHTQSLPLFAYPSAGSSSSCVNLDPVCGGSIVTMFRPGTEPRESSGWNPHARSLY